MFTTNNIVTESGDTFIPASQRPDGTWRKARRVKEGYVPQEEVPLYESKGKQFMNRNTKPEPVKLISGQTAQRPIPGLFIIEDKKQSKKKNKTNKTVEELTQKMENTKVSSNAPTTDPVKKLKNLKKRLREIELLEEKIKSGLLVKPEQEQLLKIQRKGDLFIEIEQLEELIK